MEANLTKTLKNYLNQIQAVVQSSLQPAPTPQLPTPDLLLQIHRLHPPLAHVHIIHNPTDILRHFHVFDINDDHDLDHLGTLVIIHIIDVPLFDHHALLHDIGDVPLLHAILLLDETAPKFQIPNIAAHLVLIADVLPEGPRIAMLLQSVVPPRPHHRTRSTSKVSQLAVPHVQRSDNEPIRLTPNQRPSHQPSPPARDTTAPLPPPNYPPPDYTPPHDDNFISSARVPDGNTDDSGPGSDADQPYQIPSFASSNSWLADY